MDANCHDAAGENVTTMSPRLGPLAAARSFPVLGSKRPSCEKSAAGPDIDKLDATVFRRLGIARL
jgi:hypothetical protein